VAGKAHVPSEAMPRPGAVQLRVVLIEAQNLTTIIDAAFLADMVGKAGCAA